MPGRHCRTAHDSSSTIFANLNRIGNGNMRSNSVRKDFSSVSKQEHVLLSTLPPSPALETFPHKPKRRYYRVMKKIEMHSQY